MQMHWIRKARDTDNLEDLPDDSDKKKCSFNKYVKKV